MLDLGVLDFGTFLLVALMIVCYAVIGFFVARKFAYEVVDENILWVLATPVVAFLWPIAVVIFYLVIPYLENQEAARQRQIKRIAKNENLVRANLSGK